MELRFITLVLLSALLSTTALAPASGLGDLRSRTSSTGGPWLARAAFSSDGIAGLAADIAGLPISTAALVKAFDSRNDADAFVVPTPLVKWACERHSCTRIFPTDPTLHEAAQLSGAPISAKVSKAGGECCTESLRAWLAALETRSGRRLLDVDAYLTSAPTHAKTSASLGWHIDDIDVLLIMLRGRKRFCVAGRTLGSEVSIDHCMSPGDAIFIPALTFHSGGSAEPEESLMISIAFAPDAKEDRVITSETVDRWRLVRQALLETLAPPVEHGGSGSRLTSHSWSWASSTEGAAALRGVFPLGSSRAILLQPFLPPPPPKPCLSTKGDSEADGEEAAAADAADAADAAEAADALTICTGNRCWRNGAGRLLGAACERASGARVAVRSVGCSGVCPRDAVSLCEGPECPGTPLALPAADEAQAGASAETALAMVQRARGGQGSRARLTMSLPDEETDEEDSVALPLAKRAVALLGDALFLAWSAAIQAAGLAFSLGFVLNLCGFGYRFTLQPPSLQIGTLAGMRAENAERRFLTEDFNSLFPEKH